jgi:hypothetical protein
MGLLRARRRHVGFERQHVGYQDTPCASKISDGFISPLDLVEIGLVSAEEAEEMHAIETAARTDLDRCRCSGVRVVGKRTREVRPPG